MVAVVPVQDVQAAVGAGFLDDGHEPGVVGRQEVRLGQALVRRTVLLQPVAVDAAAVDVAHVELATEFFRISVAVEVMNAAVGCLLMLMLDDRFDLPGKWRIRASLSVVVA